MPDTTLSLTDIHHLVNAAEQDWEQSYAALTATGVARHLDRLREANAHHEMCATKRRFGMCVSKGCRVVGDCPDHPGGRRG